MHDEAVRRRIRAADPLGAHDLRGTVDGPAAERVLDSVLTQGVAEPLSSVPRGRTVHRWPAMAAVIVVVAAVAVGVGVLGRSDRTASPHVGSATVPATVSPAAFARSLAEAVAVPADAQRHPGALPGLESNPDAPGRSSVTQASAGVVWTTAGSVDRTAAYVRAHRPRGWTADGESSSGPRYGVDLVIGLRYIARGPHGLVALVYVSIPRYRNGAAIIVGVQVTRSVRTPGQVVRAAAGVRGQVALVGSDLRTRKRATLHRTLDAGDTKALETRVNAAEPAVPTDYLGFRSCPVQVTQWTVTVRISRWTLTAALRDCNGVTAGVNGFAVAGGGDLVTTVLRDLHLPDDWYSR